MRRAPLWIAPLLALALGCANGTTEAESAAEAFPVPPSADAKSDSLAPSPAKQAIYDRWKARYAEIRRFKADRVLGEGYQGYLAIPEPRPAQLDADPEYAAALAALVDAENIDRDAYYDLEMLGYAAELNTGVQAQVPALREQVIAELCGGDFTGAVCEGVTDAVIQQALDAAFAAAVDEAMAPVRAAVERVHAAFWVRKTTRAGEWVQVLAADDSLVWRPKP
jgi:hypothetical protein